MDLPDGGLLKVAMEIEDNVKAINDTYSKMEILNDSLMEKLILVDRTNKLKDMEKAVDDLTSQLETYFEKCVKVKTDNVGILRKTGGILLAGSASSTPVSNLGG